MKKKTPIQVYNDFYKQFLDKINPEYINLINYFKKNNIIQYNSSIRRFVFVNHSFFIKFDTVKTITSIFKVRISSTNKYTIDDVIFGFGFYSTEYRKDKRNYNEPDLFMINGSYESKDGEFRNGLLSNKTLSFIKSPLFEKYHLNELVNDILISI